MISKFETSKSYALRLDSDDPLAEFRHRFYIQKGAIYIDGSSLPYLKDIIDGKEHKKFSETRRAIS